MTGEIEVAIIKAKTEVLNAALIMYVIIGVSIGVLGYALNERIESIDTYTDDLREQMEVLEQQVKELSDDS